MQLFKVYPLTDERVKEVALQHLNTVNSVEVTCLYTHNSIEHNFFCVEVTCLYTHYSIEHKFFCNEGDEEWCDNYVICDYDKE